MKERDSASTAPQQLPTRNPPPKSTGPRQVSSSKSRIILTTIAAIDISSRSRARHRTEIRTLGTKSDVRPISASAVIKTHAMHATDLVAQVVKVPVQAALDRALLGSRLAVPVWRGVEGEGDAVDGPRGTGAPVCIGVALQEGGEGA